MSQVLFDAIARGERVTVTVDAGTLYNALVALRYVVSQAADPIDTSCYRRGADDIEAAILSRYRPPAGEPGE